MFKRKVFKFCIPRFFFKFWKSYLLLVRERIVPSLNFWIELTFSPKYVSYDNSVPMVSHCSVSFPRKLVNLTQCFSTFLGARALLYKWYTALHSCHICDTGDLVEYPCDCYDAKRVLLMAFSRALVRQNN